MFVNFRNSRLADPIDLRKDPKLRRKAIVCISQLSDHLLQDLKTKGRVTVHEYPELTDGLRASSETVSLDKEIDRLCNFRTKESSSYSRERTLQEDTSEDSNESDDQDQAGLKETQRPRRSEGEKAQERLTDMIASQCSGRDESSSSDEEFRYGSGEKVPRKPGSNLTLAGFLDSSSASDEDMSVMTRTKDRSTSVTSLRKGTEEKGKTQGSLPHEVPMFMKVKIGDAKAKTKGEGSGGQVMKRSRKRAILSDTDDEDRLSRGESEGNSFGTENDDNKDCDSDVQVNLVTCQPCF